MPLRPTSEEPGLRPALLLMLICLASWLGLAAPPLAAQDGDPVAKPRPHVPVPRLTPPQAYEVESVELSVDIADQRARVLLRQTVRNTGNGLMELDFLVPLPLNGSVSGLVLVADGKELAGQIYPREEALGIYQEIVSRLKDPALLEFAGHGLFRARAFPVAKGARATLDLSMDYLLPKDGGRVDLDFPLANSLTQGRTIGRQEITVRVRGESVGGLFSPQAGVSVERGRDLATAGLRLDKVPPLPAFQLHYQEDPGPMGGLVLSHKPEKDEDGFFLFLAEPRSLGQDEAPAPKTVIFVLDRSGSMSGTKFRQAQAALSFVLERLGPDDGFDLIDFSSDVSLWRKETEAMTPKNRSEALEYVRSLRSGGGTNIEGALEAALGLALGDRPAYLIFLTDGVPTYGETDEFRLAENAGKGDLGRGVRIFSFGVGNDVNARLLERLSSQSNGQASFVAPEEDIEDKVGSFFAKITNPALVKPSLASSLRSNRLIPERLPDLFEGSQLTVVGRYPEGGQATLTLSGQKGQERQVFSYQADLAQGPTQNGQQIAQLWAQRRIGQIIEEIDLAAQAVPNQELVDELVGLSKAYGIMTPYTSFLAVEDQPLADTAELGRIAQRNLGELEQLTGEDANWQRATKSDLAAAATPAPAPMPMEARISDLKAMGRLEKNLGGSALIPPTIIDGRAFFMKGGRLIEGSLTEEDLRKLKAVKRFSPEYFELARQLEPGQMGFLTQASPLAFSLNGQGFLIEAE